MAVIERLDFLGVPTQDPERSRAFYRGVLGLRPDEHAEWEQWAGDTCFAIWEPEKQGMPFVAQKGDPWPLRCDDVGEMRALLEAKGVHFFGDTFDTGVCHMAIFADPTATSSCCTAGTRRTVGPPVRAAAAAPLRDLHERLQCPGASILHRGHGRGG